MADLLGARSREVVFTSGATESIAMACHGAARRDAEGQVTAMARHREDLLAEVLRLEITQDELLDRMTVEG